nr:YpmS family protein [uncultured Ligilactobacillus sp.]
MKKEQDKQFNLWKFAFFALLIVVLGLIIFIGVKISLPNSEQESANTQIEKIEKSAASVDVTMNKEDFSSAINYFLSKEQKKSGIKYRFILNKSAILMGTTKVLGKKITFSVYATPSINKDGNIVLKIKSIAVGSLSTPSSFILNYIKNNYNLKGIVQINAKENKIILRLDQLTSKNDLKVKATKMDLKQNEIKFKVLIPKN